jgi:hypothetical protein
MGYPLGTLPSYAHQANRAALRRKIAQENSAATLRAKAQRELMIEESVYRYLEQYVITMSHLSDQGVREIAEMRERMNRIRRKHSQGKRVYYGYLGETLRDFCRIAGICPELQTIEQDHLRRVVRDLGLENLGPSPFVLRSFT